MKCIQVGYKNEVGDFTFELFNNIEKAFNFIKESEKINPFEIPQISLVNANDKNLYFEDNGTLNYEDKASLFCFEED